MKTVDFSETIAASDLKVGRCRQLINFFLRLVSIEGQCHFLPYIFQVLYVLCFGRPRYQVSVYGTIGTLVYMYIAPGVNCFHLQYYSVNIVLCYKISSIK